MPLRIAHRGASAYAPENTLLAIKKAIDLKAGMIEIDVHKCLTGEIIVFHDEKIQNKKIMSTPLAEIKKICLPQNQKIPLLQEVIDLINRKAILNIELKGKDTAQGTASIIKKYVDKGWNYKDFLVTSYYYKELRQIKKTSQKIRTGLVFRGIPFGHVWLAKKIGCSTIISHKYHTTEWLVKRAKKAGLKIYVWTVNDEKEIKFFKEIKVDGIITDYPDKV